MTSYHLLLAASMLDCQTYCNRTATFSDTHWYTMDKAIPLDHPKPHNKPNFRTQ
jgi:hypothetical protein